MTLPGHLLAEILRVTNGDEARAERLAREWVRVERQASEVAERVRAQARTARCVCARRPAEPTPDGRCSRCWGTPA